MPFFGLTSSRTLLGIGVYVASRRLPKAQRAYHYITGTILLVAGISYYAMAIQEGVWMRHIGPHTFRYVKDSGCDVRNANFDFLRQMYWARCMRW